MENIEHRHRRVILAILASISLHALAFLLFYLLVPRSVKVYMYRVYVLGLPRSEEKKRLGGKESAIPQMEMERKKPKVRAIPEEVMEFGLPTEKAWLEGSMLPTEVGEIAMVPKAKAAPELERHEWTSPTELGPFEESLREALEEGVTLNVGRYYPLVLIDPQNKTKLKGYVHLPVRRIKPKKGRLTPLVPSEFTHLSLMRHAAGLPLPTFLNIHLHGYTSYDSLNIHDLRRFPFVIVDPRAGIRVRRVADLADYLEEGGFAMMRDGRTFRQTLQELQQRSAKRAALTLITLEHPLFHSFYDITEYSSSGRTCPYAITPLVGIESYGRLVAVLAPLKYIYEELCLSNKLFINILVYGLIQPGSLGSQYVMTR